MSDLLKSKRFWAAVANVVFVLVSPYLPGVTQEQVLAVTLGIVAFIGGETYRPIGTGKAALNAKA